MGRWVVTGIAAALAVSGASVQNISLVHWTSSSISAFGVLFVRRTAFPVFQAATNWRSRGAAAFQ